MGAIVVALVEGVGASILSAMLVGIAAPVVLSFFINDRWVFGMIGDG